jgi:hypothetical protein
MLKHLKKGFSENPMVKGAFREPGEITIFWIPFALQCKIMDWAKGIVEYLMWSKNTTRVILNQSKPKKLKV